MTYPPQPHQPYGSAPPPGSSEWTAPSFEQVGPYSQAPIEDARPAMAYAQPPTAIPWWAGPTAEGDPGTLDLPWYGIGPLQAVKRAYQKAFRYDGRASRGEYWWFALFEGCAVVVVYLVLLIPLALATSGGPGVEERFGVGFALAVLLLALAGLQFFVVGLSLAVRRLHDAGMSGWMYLLTFIPYIGGVVHLVFMCQSPKPEGMRYDRGFAHWQVAAAYGVADAPYGYPGGFR